MRSGQSGHETKSKILSRNEEDAVARRSFCFLYNLTLSSIDNKCVY